MYGRHIAEPDIVARSHAGQHARHVVEENLYGAHLLGGRLVLALAGVQGGVGHWAGREGAGGI